MIKKFIVCVALVCAAVRFHAAAPIRYTFSFPEPQHRWLQVDATFPDLTGDTLELRMSRSSPGRYSLHDFAKNVYDVHAFGSDGRELAPARPDPYGWNVSASGGAVTVQYKVFGDRLDGTYLAVDTTHAHINMPAAIMWAHRLEDRPAFLEFVPPPGSNWRVATQLFAAESGDRFPYETRKPVPDTPVPDQPAPVVFTAPNLQYLMDSPVEFGPVAIREFSVGGRAFRFAVHQTGTDAELDAFARDVERIVREEGEIYGEYPTYEPGAYTFLADYLPYADGDGMEHRNSSVLTSASTIAAGRAQLLDTVAHEFFHCWNVERIRPKGLEPFDFDRANISDSLWLAEGFTEYYGPLVLRRAGLVDLGSMLRTLGRLVSDVTNSPARAVRSAADMSRMAPFIDGGISVDRTNWSTTVLSYYTYGGAIAAGLDLALRDRSDGHVTLDDFMRAMWRRYGKPGASREGYVDRPYTMADAEATLGEVSGDRTFAHEFFAKYITGREILDYGRLLDRAGLVLRRRNAGRAWLGDVRVDAHGSRVATLVAPTWPAYGAGLEQDAEQLRVDGTRIAGDTDLAAVLRRHKPGDRVPIAFVDRAGRATNTTVTLAEDPALEIVTTESAGGALSAAQRGFRERWLKTRS